MVVGSHGAEAAGIAKELSDARGGSGFSFADLAADLAGIRFAKGVTDSELSLSHLADSFTVANYLPSHAGLPEGIPWDKFLAEYGSTADDRFRRTKAVIGKRIERLKGYRRQ